jgi:hypothetical protein
MSVTSNSKHLPYSIRTNVVEAPDLDTDSCSCDLGIANTKVTGDRKGFLIGVCQRYRWRFYILLARLVGIVSTMSLPNPTSLVHLLLLERRPADQDRTSCFRDQPRHPVSPLNTEDLGTVLSLPEKETKSWTLTVRQPRL